MGLPTVVRDFSLFRQPSDTLSFYDKEPSPPFVVRSNELDLLSEAPPAGQLTTEESARGGLGRHLGIVSTTFLVIGRIIGTGIFSTPTSITSDVGSAGAALLLWVFGFILSFSGLLVWLELGCIFPRSGGEKVYLEAVYRSPRFLTSSIIAIQAIVTVGFTASGCIAFASHAVIAASGLQNPSEIHQRSLAAGLILFVTAIHSLIPKASVRFMNVVGFIKVLLLLFIISTGFLVLGGGSKAVRNPTSSFQDAFSGSSNTSFYRYASAILKVMYTYAGWTNAAYVLNEVKHPIHTLKISGPVGLGLCGILYILTNIAYYSAATPKEIVARGGSTLATYMIGKVFGDTAMRIISAFIALSAMGNVLSITFAQSRLNQEVSKEGVIPFAEFWASTWPFGAPSAGLLLHSIPALLLILVVPLGEAFEFVVNISTYPLVVLSLFVTMGLFILRWERPDMQRPFKVWLPVAGFFLVGQVFLIIAPFLDPPDESGESGSLPFWLHPIVGFAILLSGGIYWFVWRKLLPVVGKYRLRTVKVALKDDTVVTVFQQVRYW